MSLRFKPLDFAAMAAFLAYSSSVTALPICLVSLSGELGMSLSQAGGLGLAKGVLVFATLLCGGVVAALFGKVRSIGVSCLMLGAGMFVYGVAPSYGVLFLAVALLGFGGGVLEALINPLVQELHPADSGRYLSFVNAFWAVGALVTMLGTGEALTREVSWRVIMGSLGLVSLLAGILFMTLPDTRSVGGRPRVAAVLAGKWQILRRGDFWLFSALMAVGGAAEGAFTYWSASLLQLDFGVAPRAAGIGGALYAAGMIAARFLWGWLVPQWRLWELLLGSALGALVLGLIFPLVQGVGLAYLSLFALGFAMSCFWPSLQSYAVDRMACDPTNAFILLSCGGIVGFSSASWTMGALGDWVGLRASFWIVPVHMALMVGLLLLERRRG